MSKTAVPFASGVLSEMAHRFTYRCAYLPGATARLKVCARDIGPVGTGMAALILAVPGYNIVSQRYFGKFLWIIRRHRLRRFGRVGRQGWLSWGDIACLMAGDVGGGLGLLFSTRCSRPS